MANHCQLLLTTIVFIAIVLQTSVVPVEGGKKKDKGLIIVLSNGGCGGNILVQTAKDGKKGGGHKIVVKGGDSGGCGCSSSCSSCGGGGDHHHVQHVPIPIPVPPGHPIPPMHHPEMHAAMMSQLVPAFSAEDPHQSSGSSDSSSDDSKDQDTQASDSSDDSNKESTGSSSDSSASSSNKSNMVAPLFIPMNAITPPWFHGSPVFMDPSSQNHLSSTMDKKPKGYSSSSASSLATSESNNHDSNMEKGEFAQSSNVSPTFNDPMFNLHGAGGNYLAPGMGFQGGFEGNPLITPSQSASDPSNKDPTESNKSQGSRGGRAGYLQPLIDSVQRLLRGPGPLREIEQGLVRQGQRMQASFSSLVPVAITNYTSYLPSLPGLRSSSGNSDRKPGTPRRSRYLESLRVRLRPLTTMEGNRVAPFIENLWKNIRGRGSTATSPSAPNQVKNQNQELNNNVPNMLGHHHHVHPVGSFNGHHHQHHFNIPGQQNNQVMQQYLEQILTSKWWEWPTGGLLGPNLNQY